LGGALAGLFFGDAGIYGAADALEEKLGWRL
jgi:hypothetical protein